MNKQSICILATDQFPISSTLYLPAQPNNTFVMVCSATGVKRSYYDLYAIHLCERGFTVLTYDYRGIGGSKVGDNWKGKTPSMSDWGRKDLEGVIQWVNEYYPEKFFTAVVHSVGGQLIGLAASNNSIKAVLAVASQSGYIGHWSGVEKLKFYGVMYFAIPVATYLFGRMPGVLLGSEDLPKGVALQWAYWCRSRHYIVDRKGAPVRDGFEKYDHKIRFYCIADDLMYGPLKSVEALAGYYKSAKTEVVVRQAEDYGVDNIGHFGFFQSYMPAIAWDETATWLKEREAESCNA
ncbi:alpha/beta fold hydrolase [Alkalimarinus coralli]|uniref:alpha/beta hydrolase family protein n=1 Tax=Alkalimarinus coralli TaxID=2935863 RepID=UPI00202AF269|nr:alpha/beta fold hydrolase [Alkalimarinus coralli]